ncbi:MAG: hypothetical protein ACOY5B_18035 [Spirochaetota bacterium]
MSAPEVLANPHRRWRRPRFWLKLGALLIAAGFTATTLWFILRAEQIILSRLPREIQAAGISVSFLGRSFILKGVRVSGRVGSPCEGRLLLEIAELTGSFVIRDRRLTNLSVSGAELNNQGWQKACFAATPQSRVLRLSEIASASGLEINFRQVRFRLPYLGEASATGSFRLAEPQPDTLQLRAAQLALSGVKIQGEARQLAVDLNRTNGSWQLVSGNFTAVLGLKQLEKIPKLSSRRLTVLAGNADIRLTATARQGNWKILTHVDLSKVRLRGEPFYSMPMGLLQLTPENVWPMVEDSPGLLSFHFETEAHQGQLIREFTADLRRALTSKVKVNLKKKVPVLPF